MKTKHLLIRVDQCRTMATASNCVRAKHGALLLDPQRNVVLMDGYNGGPRGDDGPLCGGEHCHREQQRLSAHASVEVGCHHAEMNVICNAAANGTSCVGAWLIVTGEPCTMCAKLIHHAGIERVLMIVSEEASPGTGEMYLHSHGIETERFPPAMLRKMALEVRQKNYPPT